MHKMRKQIQKKWKFSTKLPSKQRIKESKLKRSAVPLNSPNNTDDRRVTSSNNYSDLLKEHDLKVRPSIGQSQMIILKGNKSKRERATVIAKHVEKRDNGRP